MTKLHFRRLTLNLGQRLLLVFMLGFTGAQAYAQGPNPKAHYLHNGAPVAGWHMALGDESEWYQPVKSDKQSSNNKAINVEKVTVDDKQGLRLKWRKKDKDGAFSILGQEIDIKALESSIGLAIDLRVEKRLKQSLTLSMDCGYPCRGSLNLKPILEAYPQNEWFTLPIPLRCFAQNGTDLSKMNTPLHFQTKGKFQLVVGEVRLIQLPDSIDWCK